MTANRLVRPLFLLGSMRSGTTLLANRLGSSPDIAYCPFELKLEWSTVAGVPMASATTGDCVCHEYHQYTASPETRSKLIAAFRQRINELAGKNPDAIFLNKNPHLCNKLPVADALFPDARYLWIDRPLPQVAASIQRLFERGFPDWQTWHWWPLQDERYRNRCWQAAFSQQELIGIPANRIFPGGDIRFIAEYWLESNRACSEFFAAHPDKDLLRVSYMQLTKNPDAVFSEISTFLDRPITGATDDTDWSIDPSLGDEWHSTLSAADAAALLGFARDAEQECNRIFSGDMLYMNELAALCGKSWRTYYSSTRFAWLHLPSAIR